MTEAHNRDSLIRRRRDLAILGFGVLLTTVAEVFYLVVWGVTLFPSGGLAGNAIWTVTCGIATGSVIGPGTLILAEPIAGDVRSSGSGRSSFWASAAIAPRPAERLMSDFPTSGGRVKLSPSSRPALVRLSSAPGCMAGRFSVGRIPPIS